MFPLVQVIIVSFLGLTLLDVGQCSHVVAYAAFGYAGGLLLIVPRRDRFTPTDEFLIRWGFVILYSVLVFAAAVIWALRGHVM